MSVEVADRTDFSALLLSTQAASPRPLAYVYELKRKFAQAKPRGDGSHTYKIVAGVPNGEH